jgi:hypothetical protein
MISIPFKDYVAKWKQNRVYCIRYMKNLLTNDQVVLQKIVETERAIRMPDSKPADYFERFVAWEVLKNHDPTESEIEGGMMDAGDDGGIDALFLLVDGQIVDSVSDMSKARQGIELELVVIQSKLETSFSGNAINKLHSIVPVLLKLNSELNDNSDILHSGIREFRSLFVETYLSLVTKHPKLKISFYVCACADDVNIAPNATGWSNPIIIACKSTFPNAEVQVHLWGAKQLYDSHAKLPPTSFTLSVLPGPIATKQGSYVALIPIGQLLGMIIDSDGSTRHYLFESNVRDFYVKSQVNDEIGQSVTNLGELDFWWLNNGLTILVTKISSVG